MIISLFVFALLALGLTKSLVFAKYLAEDNLYEATALTVASSLIEQIKGASFDSLENPKQIGGNDSFEMIGGGGQPKMLILDEFNDLQVPVVTENDGSTAKTMKIRVKPSITEMSGASGYWILIEYTYDHPRNGRTRTNFVRNARSTVPSI